MVTRQVKGFIVGLISGIRRGVNEILKHLPENLCKMHANTTVINNQTHV
jgi:hypothetical protein